MILATRSGNRELFGAFDSSVPVPRPSQAGGSMTWSGRRVEFEDACGLPAFMRGVRLLRETTAMMPAKVFRGFDDEREIQKKVPQLGLLRRPNPDMTPFQVWEHTVGAMLGGNAFLWKVKVRGEVKALYPVDPSTVTVKHDGGGIMFEIRDRPNGQVKRTVGRDMILHIPGILGPHPCIGVSVVEAHRQGLGTQLSRQEFEARFLANDGAAGVVIKHPENRTPEQRREMRDSYMSRHAGVSNAGRPAILWGGWELDRLSVTLEDAQYIETAKFSVQETGRMLGVPGGLLGDPEAPGGETPEQENMRFLEYGLGPWMSRFEQALACDTDISLEPDWSVELDPSDLLRADIKTRFDAYRLARQGGWIKANEIRAKEGYEAAEGGDEIQVTPVGGAPNTPKENNDNE